jgi:uncharacterized protein
VESCLYEGRVVHRRFGSVAHAFSFPLCMVYLDLDELPRVFAGRWLWSTTRPALARFRRRDHLGDPAKPLDRCVRDLVERETGRRPEGPVRLLTQLRHAGYGFTPLSLYYCFERDAERLAAVVAEVTNTPWGERHRYVIGNGTAPGVSSGAAPRARNTLRSRQPKAFHVSPFLGMDLEYRFAVRTPGPRLGLRIANHEGSGACVFAASLALERREITGRSLARALARYPLMTWQGIAGIYWQALRLRRKGASFHPHPRHSEAHLELAS